ncbi:MAG: hypothetical protein NZ455_03425 [Bacteroidia bacterium]|nr:hypothetical protein [Bacteroidia bacterium]
MSGSETQARTRPKNKKSDYPIKKTNTNLLSRIYLLFLFKHYELV